MYDSCRVSRLFAHKPRRGFNWRAVAGCILGLINPDVMAIEQPQTPEARTASSQNASSTADESEKRVSFLAENAARDTITDTSDPFLSRLRKSEIAAMTGSSVAAKTLGDARSFARDFFGGAVLEFTAPEREAVKWYVHQIDQRTAKHFPFFAKQPWSFIKVRADLCGSFSFTRSRSIVLSERTYSRMVSARRDQPDQALRKFAPLLLHEQLHVLQRSFPERFHPLYEQVFGFRRASVQIDDWIDSRQVSNPDGTDEDWVFPTNSKANATSNYWLGTILVGDKPIPRMGQDFLGIAVLVEQQSDESFTMPLGDSGRPTYRRLEDCPEIMARFPIAGGHDHPNEIAAYLFADSAAELFGLAKSDASKLENVVVARSRAWFREHL